MNAILRFRKHWEQFEEKKLLADRDSYIAERNDDAEKFSEDKFLEIKQKEETLIDAFLNPEEPEEKEEASSQAAPPTEKGSLKVAEATSKDAQSKGGKDTALSMQSVPTEPVDEALELQKKNNAIAKIKFDFMLDCLQKDEDYKKRFDVLPSRKVVKFHSLFRAIFYFLEVDKDLICIEGTQKFYWKKARHHWNADLIAKMRNYQILNAKANPIKSYHTINFVENLIKDDTEEELNKYNYALGLVFKWLKFTIEQRKKDIIYRLANSKKLREIREQKIEEEKTRMETRTAKCEEEREKYQTEHAADIQKYAEYQVLVQAGTPPDLDEDEEPPKPFDFDEKYFYFGFDEENPPIAIPAEVIDDKNNDWKITAEQLEEMITEHNTAVAEAIAAANAPPPPVSGGKK